MRDRNFSKQLAPLTRPIIKAIIFILSFFILIGDSTRWLIKQIFMVPGRFFIAIVIFFKKIFKLIKKRLQSFRFPHIKKPNISVKLPNLSFPKVNVPNFHFDLPSFSLPKMSMSLPHFKLNKKKKVKKTKNYTAISKKTKVIVSKRSPLSVKMKYFFLGLFCMFLIASSIGAYEFIQLLPNPKEIGKVNYPVSTQIYDRKGRLIYEIYNDQNRTPVALNKLPKYIAQASIAIEDKDFYNNNGISIFGGILRAVKDMIISHQLQGGSTITQQLVKSALLSPERTITRKIKEIILALWTERIYSKQQILEMYLNQVPYGGPAYGIEEAAETYYDKKAENLSLSEAALLAGLPQAPTYYSPYYNPDMTLRRRNTVLLTMYQQKYISETDYKKAVSEPIHIQPLKQNIKAPHFVFYIKSILENEYGTDQLEQGGLRIVTSIDLDLQEKLESILSDELSKDSSLNIHDGAMIVTDPSTGEILAMVGSKDYYQEPSGAFNDTTALRQPGSSIKPLMYSLALERGYTAASIIDDSPISFSSAGSDVYTPLNYDNKFHGKVTLRSALANSYNVPAVKVLNTLGISNFISHAQDMGITTWNDPQNYGLSITLGGAEVKMTDMAVAFGVFANSGKKIDLHPIMSITDFKGNSLYSLDTKNVEAKQVISDDTAFIISNILSDNVARLPAFGANSQLEIKSHQVAVKTGTTNDKKDNWTIGYTPKFLTAVWVGNNDNTPMNPILTSGITGAAPIWNKAMTYLLNSYEYNSVASNDFIIPSNIVRRLCGGKIEYFTPGTETKSNCAPEKPLPLPSISPFMR